MQILNLFRRTIPIAKNSFQLLGYKPEFFNSQCFNFFISLFANSECILNTCTWTVIIYFCVLYLSPNMWGDIYFKKVKISSILDNCEEN